MYTTWANQIVPIDWSWKPETGRINLPEPLWCHYVCYAGHCNGATTALSEISMQRKMQLLIGLTLQQMAWSVIFIWGWSKPIHNFWVMFKKVLLQSAFQCSLAPVSFPQRSLLVLLQGVISLQPDKLEYFAALFNVASFWLESRHHWLSWLLAAVC